MKDSLNVTSDKLPGILDRNKQLNLYLAPPWWTCWRNVPPATEHPLWVEAIKKQRMQLAKNSDCDATRSGSVLVVEDHDSFRGIICAALRSYLPGWEVLEADSVSEASALVSSRPIRVIASDFTLSDGTAKDLVDNLSPALSSSPRVVIFSNYTSDDLQPLLTRGEVHAFVPKENGIKALAETIQKESSPAR